MLDRMQQNLEDIKDRGSTHDVYLRHMFRTLMISTNMIFRDFIQQEKDKWETEGTTTSDELSNLDWRKFNNIVATTEWSKSDPKDAAIVALTTRVNILESVRSHGGGGNPTKITTTSLSGRNILNPFQICSCSSFVLPFVRTYVRTYCILAARL